ncbi:unnamed protein product, partial [Cylicostephanus goldi]
RLTPIKNKSLTIPRLELLAIQIGVRLTDFILKEMPVNISTINIYSDSKVALHWIQSNENNGIFVGNRVRNIKQAMYKWLQSKKVSLRYISTDMNPADLATRGLPKSQMNSQIWWYGPDFLRKHEEEWSDTEAFEWQDNNTTELTDLQIPIAAHLTSTDKSQYLRFEQYSDIFKCKKITALVLKALKAMLYNKLSTNKQTKLEKTIPEIVAVGDQKPLALTTTKDIEVAETIILKLNQRAKNQHDYQELGIFKDEKGILRCRGRVKTEHWLRDTKEPILLDPQHPTTKAIIRQYHQNCGHQGTNATLANIRSRFWIPRGRQIIKNCLNKCVICKRWNGRPYLYPDSPPLPKERTDPCRPFQYVGIDLAGPFKTATANNEEVKRWVVLITCMTTRAIHLEIVNNLSATQLVDALRRFSARRGQPQTIISDNATNLKLGQEIVEEITKASNSCNIGNFLTAKGIEWKFITPLSPWKGGFYERLIGALKLALKKTFGRRIPKTTEFETIITECEAMVNSRPMTYAGSTLDDSVILRPIDFLSPRAKIDLIPAQGEETQGTDDSYLPSITTKGQAIEYYEKVKKHLANLWELWNQQYLLELRNHHQKRIRQKQFTRKHPKMGEVVIIMDDSQPKGNWNLGLVIGLTKDKDGEIRSVQLKTAKSTIERSVNMLIPLELDEENGKINGKIGNEVNFHEIVLSEADNSEERKQDIDGESIEESSVREPEKSFTVQFPPEVTLHTYQVHVKYSVGNSTKSSYWACPPSPYCEQIKCNFCTAMVSNPECWPHIAIGVSVILMYLGILTLYLLAKALRKEDIPLIELRNHRKGKWEPSTLIKIVALSTATWCIAEACQQNIVIQSSTIQCINKEKNCTKHQTVIGKLSSSQPELCLYLQNREETQHIIKITLQEIVLRCYKETLYFTRNTEVRVQYRKRCPHMGSCTGKKCAAITPESKIEELSLANNYSGITYCTESCGGLGCSCGYPSSGCLFYRTYHVPVDNLIYEVFECPSWQEKANIIYEEFQNSKTARYKVELAPQVMKPLGNTKIKITSMDWNPITLLSKRFITNEKNTAYLEEKISFSYACQNKTLAINTCNIKDTCKCNPAEDYVNCYCSNNNASDSMHLYNTLPVPIPNGAITIEGKHKVPTVRIRSTSTEIAIVLDPSVMYVRQEITEFSCQIVPKGIIGCYNCWKGAIATLICYSSVRYATTQVDCNAHQFLITCSKDGTENN